MSTKLHWIDEPDQSTAEIRLGWVYLHFSLRRGHVEIDNGDGWGWNDRYVTLNEGKLIAESKWEEMKQELLGSFPAHEVPKPHTKTPFPE